MISLLHPNQWLTISQAKEALSQPLSKPTRAVKRQLLFLVIVGYGPIAITTEELCI